MQKFFIEKKSMKKFFAYLLALLILVQGSGILAMPENKASQNRKTSITIARGGLSGDAANLLQITNVEFSYHKDGVTKSVAGTATEAVSIGTVNNTSLILKYYFQATEDITIPTNDTDPKKTFLLSYPEGLDTTFLGNDYYPENVGLGQEPKFKYKYLHDERQILVEFLKDFNQGTEGWIETSFHFSDQFAGFHRPHTFSFPISNTASKDVTFFLKPNGVTESTSISGRAMRDNVQTDKDPNAIEWTSRFNLDYELFKQGSIPNVVNYFNYKDGTDKNLEMTDADLNSVKLFRLKIDTRNGNIIERTPVSGAIFSKDNSAGTLTLDLNGQNGLLTDIDNSVSGGENAKYLTDAYEIVYRTSILPSAKELTDKKTMIDFKEGAKVQFGSAYSEAEVEFTKYPFVEKKVDGVGSNILFTFTSPKGIETKGFFNPKKLRWTIWLNKSGTVFESAEKNQIKLYDLISKIDWNGENPATTSELGAPTNVTLYSYTYAPDGKNYTDETTEAAINLTAGSPNATGSEYVTDRDIVLSADKVYKLVYTTDINYSPKSHATDSGKLDGAGFDAFYRNTIRPYSNGSAFRDSIAGKDLAVKEDTYVKFGAALEKHAIEAPAFNYSNGKPRVQWWIDVNKSKQPLKQGDKIIDTLPGDMVHDHTIPYKIYRYKGGVDLEITTDIHKVKNKNLVDVTGDNIIRMDNSNANSDSKTVTFHVNQDTSDAYRIEFFANYDIQKTYDKNVAELIPITVGQKTTRTEKEPILAGNGITKVKPQIPNDEDDRNGPRNSWIDYDKKLMYWVVVVRPAKEGMIDPEFTDYFPNGGLELVDTANPANSFKFYNERPFTPNSANPNEFIAVESETLTPYSGTTPEINLIDNVHNGQKGFKIKFPGTLTKAVYVVYTTKFSRETHTNVKTASETDALKYVNKLYQASWKDAANPGITISKNEADLNPVDPDPDMKEEYKEAPFYEVKPVITATDRQNADSTKPGHTNYGTSNIAKNGVFARKDYVGRRIKWIVDANYLAEDLDSLSVEDRIGEGHKFLKDTLVVHELKREKDTGNILPGDEIPMSGNYTITDDTDSTFTINFTNPDKAYTITFYTELTGKSRATYDNTATLKYSFRSESREMSASASVNFADHNKEVNKKGKYLNDSSKPFHIGWEAFINTALSEIHNPEITDELSVGHSYDEDTIKLERKIKQTTDTSSNYNGVDGYYRADDWEIVPDNAYTKKIILLDAVTGQQKLEIKFPASTVLTSEYRLSYQSFINKKPANNQTASVNINLENKVTLRGDAPFTTGPSKSYQLRIVDLHTSAGSMEPPVKFAPVTIKKIDGNSANGIPGVSFTLQDITNNKLHNLNTTDTNGEIVINLPVGEYRITESAIPGYTIADPQTVSITKTNLKERQTLIFKNYKTLRTIKVKKTGEDGSPLNGITFTLTKGSDKKTATTNADGLATFTNVSFGPWTLVETSTATGYLLDSTPREITVDKDSYSEMDGDTPVLILPIKNYKMRSIQVVKRDAADSKPLPNAKFKLFGATADGKIDESNLIGAEQATDDYGITQFTGLSFNTYFIKETVAPEGYSLLAEPKKIILDSSSPMIENVIIENSKLILVPYVPIVEEPKDKDKPNDGSDKPKDDPKKPNEESGKEPGTDSGKDPDKETEKEPGTEPGTTPTPTPTPEPSPTPTPEAEQPEQPKLPSSTVVNTPLEGELNINDDDIPTTLVQPKNGKVEIIGKKIIYTPDKDFVGKDKFTVQITRPDGSTYEEEIEIDVEVPKGSTKLPKTAGTAAFLFFILGTMMLGLGFWSKRK